MADQGAGQAGSVAEPKKVPLVQVMGLRNNAPNLAASNPNFMTDARLVNCYAEKQADGSWEIEKRPGLSRYINLPSAGQSGGWFVWQRYAYAVVYTSPPTPILYVIDLNTSAVVETVNLLPGLYNYTFDVMAIGPATSIVIVGNGAAAYTIGYGTNPPTITQITDPDFPTNFVPGWAILDGTVYVMDNTGAIKGSDINTPSSWNALNTINANSDPDVPVALAKHLTYVVALKQWTTNVFFDNANPAPGSPLSVQPDAQIPYGCGAASSVQEIDGTLIWMTSGKDIAPQLGRMDALSFNIISTPQVDRLLQGANLALSSVSYYSWTMKIGGHRFYGLVNWVQNWALVYDLDQQLFYLWTDINGNSFRVVQVNDSTQLGVTLGMDFNNGTIYMLRPDYLTPTDVDSAGGLHSVSVDVYTPSYSGETRRKKQLNCMFFNADKDAGSVLQVRHNEDDYQTSKWSNFRDVDLSAETPILTQCGSFRRRAWHFHHQRPTKLRLNSVELQLDIGTL